MTKKEIQKYFKYEDDGRLYRLDTDSYPQTISKSGYYLLTFRNKNYYVHKLISVILFGDRANKLCTDHIDGNPLNNKAENLRLVTKRENALNQKLRNTNKSGVVGVHKHSTWDGWVAQIGSNNKIRHLGLFKTKEEAIAARQAANILYGYHQNHGAR